MKVEPAERTTDGETRAVAAAQLYERLLLWRSAGDIAAFEEVVAAYSPRLRYYLRKLLDDPAAAEDALQDVWFAAFRNLRRLRAPEAFTAWIYRIARDRAFRELRRRGRPPRFADLSAAADAPAQASDDGDFSAEDAERVHRGLNSLAPEHRDALTLRFLENMTYEQIAAIVAKPIGTVRSRIHYAKRALRAWIEGDLST